MNHQDTTKHLRIRDMELAKHEDGGGRYYTDVSLIWVILTGKQRLPYRGEEKSAEERRLIAQHDRMMAYASRHLPQAPDKDAAGRAP